MTVEEGQREVRTVFLGGFPGTLVTAVLWLASAAAATWATTRLGILILVLGGAFIFPMMQLVLRAMGRRASLPQGHPFNALAMQIAFMVPLCIPVVAGATLYRLEWFYPAFMIVVGAHYLPFCFLYGLSRFLVLGGILITAGILIGLYVPGKFALGGWLTGAVLFAFAMYAAARMKALDRPSEART